MEFEQEVGGWRGLTAKDAKDAKWDVQLTDLPVGFILISTFWAQSHVDAASETRIEQQSQ
jgi:hypothetical protein